MVQARPPPCGSRGLDDGGQIATSSRHGQEEVLTTGVQPRRTPDHAGRSPTSHQEARPLEEPHHRARTLCRARSRTQRGGSGRGGGSQSRCRLAAGGLLPPVDAEGRGAAARSAGLQELEAQRASSDLHAVRALGPSRGSGNRSAPRCDYVPYSSFMWSTPLVMPRRASLSSSGLSAATIASSKSIVPSRTSPTRHWLKLWLP